MRVILLTCLALCGFLVSAKRLRALVGDTLVQGSSLYEGDYLQSSNGVYRAIMQTDGNFVIYNSGGKAIWTSKTQNKGTGPYRFLMQTNGNIAIYDGTWTWLWSSRLEHYYGSGDGYKVVMENDGNLVTYDGTDRKVWASDSGTNPFEIYGNRLDIGETLKPGFALMSPNKNYIAAMQHDCNFVLYDANGNTKWSTGTGGIGPAPCRLIAETIGRLALYDRSSRKRWDSGSYESAGGWLFLEDNGKLVLRDTWNGVIWST